MFGFIESLVANDQTMWSKYIGTLIVASSGNQFVRILSAVIDVDNNTFKLNLPTFKVNSLPIRAFLDRIIKMVIVDEPNFIFLSVKEN